MKKRDMPGLRRLIMKLTKLEQISCLIAPCFFGIVLIICGIIVTYKDPIRIHGIMLVCSGLICMSLYCVCLLLAKIIDKK